MKCIICGAPTPYSHRRTCSDECLAAARKRPRKGKGLFGREPKKRKPKYVPPHKQPLKVRLKDPDVARYHMERDAYEARREARGEKGQRVPKPLPGRMGNIGVGRLFDGY